MRRFCILLIAGIYLLSTSCSTTENSTYLTPVTTPTINAYKLGSPVENKLEAVIVAHIWMEGSRTVSVEEPQVVFVEKITLENAYQKIGWGESFLYKRPKDTQVWLVIFEGEWQFMFPVPDGQGNIPTLEPPFHGCEFSMFESENGDPIAGGDVVCPAD